MPLSEDDVDCVGMEESEEEPRLVVDGEVEDVVVSVTEYDDSGVEGVDASLEAGEVEVGIEEGAGTPVNHVEVTVDVDVSVSVPSEDDGRGVVVGVDESLLTGREDVADEACVLLSPVDQYDVLLLLPGRLVEGTPSLDEGGKSLVGDNGVELVDVEASVGSELADVVEDSATESVDCVLVGDTGTELEAAVSVVDPELCGSVEDSVAESVDCVLVGYSVVATSLVASPDVTLLETEDEEVAP